MSLSVVVVLALSVHVPHDIVPQPRKRSLETDQIIPRKDQFANWMSSLGGQPIHDDDHFSTMISKLADAVKRYSTKELEIIKREHSSLGITEEATDSSEYPYFAFLPTFKGKAVPGGPAISWVGQCFQNITLQAAMKRNDSIELTLTMSNAKSYFCSELTMLGTTDAFKIQETFMRGPTTIEWDISESKSTGVWDATHNGIRAFMFMDGITTTLSTLTTTSEMFTSCATETVYDWVADLNVDFLAKYRGVKMQKRSVTDVVLDESLIHSGDMFGVMRLDGLEPIMAWAMGSTTGHSAVALWHEGQLYVCESTSSSSYWPTNGVQKELYRDWIVKTNATSHNIIHLPLAPEYRELFNETLAWEWMESVEGLDYGFHNMMWGTVDTVKDNYPCIPPDYTRCLTWELIEIVLPLLGRYIPKFTSVYDQAFNRRLGTHDLDFPGILEAAHAKNIDARTIPTIVEQDGWMYNTTRNGQPVVGPSLVCCTLVCHMWKSAGIFEHVNGTINCNEMSNWDDYTLRIFDSAYVRPKQCVQADPNSSVCQLIGEYTLDVDHSNSRTPEPHIAENCPSLPPSYTKPGFC